MVMLQAGVSKTINLSIEQPWSTEATQPGNEHTANSHGPNIGRPSIVLTHRDPAANTQVRVSHGAVNLLIGWAEIWAPAFCFGVATFV